MKSLITFILCLVCAYAFSQNLKNTTTEIKVDTIQKRIIIDKDFNKKMNSLDSGTQESLTDKTNHNNMPIQKLDGSCCRTPVINLPGNKMAPMPGTETLDKIDKYNPNIKDSLKRDIYSKFLQPKENLDKINIHTDNTTNPSEKHSVNNNEPSPSGY